MGTLRNSAISVWLSKLRKGFCCHCVLWRKVCISAHIRQQICIYSRSVFGTLDCSSSSSCLRDIFLTNFAAFQQHHVPLCHCFVHLCVCSHFGPGRRCELDITSPPAGLLLTLVADDVPKITKEQCVLLGYFGFTLFGVNKR